MAGLTRGQPSKRWWMGCHRLPSWLGMGLVVGCANTGEAPANVRPSFIAGEVHQTTYDGSTDDLLTAGLGRTGLATAVAPAFADPARPTPAELRRNAIHANYRALVDTTAAGGYGTLYGPNVSGDGVVGTGDGKVAGVEAFAVVDDGSGKDNVVLMVQLPANFDPARACIVTATSSGSRGIYGAIGTAGEWGLKRGCAVAYTDKGTGNGFHDLVSDTVTRPDGTTGAAPALGTQAHFRADLTAVERANFNAIAPDRVAYKHAHSQRHAEVNWGQYTLQAVKLALYVINEHHGAVLKDAPQRRAATFNASNTTVIASSVSNGGGAALAAAEQDTEGLIDGVAVSEPNVNPAPPPGLSLRVGTTPVPVFGKPLLDYFSFANLYQPCAALSSPGGVPIAATLWPAAYTTAAQNRCAALAQRGLLSGSTLAEQAADALARLHEYGWGLESDFLQASMFRFATNSIVVTYANAYGRFKVSDRVCGYSFAATDPLTGAVLPQSPVVQAGLFSTGNGIPPTSGVSVVFDKAVGAPTQDFLAISPTSGQADFALDGALCLRALVSGRDPTSGAALTGELKAQSNRVIEGMNAVRRTARLQGKPTVIVAGRDDTLIPVNHAARAYLGQHWMAESGERTRYYEVTNAQHFDAFIALGAALGYDTRYVPLHIYFNRAMDVMWHHLMEGAALPPSQVVRTTPRLTGESLQARHVPTMAVTPLTTDRIEFSRGVLTVAP